MKKTLLIPLLLLLIGLAWQGPQLLKAWRMANRVELPLSDCDLNLGPCRATLPSGAELVLEVSPRPIPVLLPLQFKLRLSGQRADQAVVDLTGVDMEMGFNRITLRPKDDGVLEGQGSLPVCVQGRMVWQAQVLLGQHGEIAVPFRFASGH